MSWTVSVSTAGPVHVPPAMLSTSPTWPAELEIVGSDAQRGAAGSTVALRSERTEAAPSAFAAVLTATSVLPTSAASGVYLAPVAPAIERQPEASQRSQDTAYVVSGLACQAKPVAVSVAPWAGVPWMTGRAVLTGGAAATAPVR